MGGQCYTFNSIGDDNTAKLNFLIKYGIMKFGRQSGHESVGYAEYEVDAYLPVACHVIKEIKVYDLDGSWHMEYDVVFTKNYLPPITEEYIVPSWGYHQGYSNGTIVKELYDDYDSAKKIAT